MSYRPKRMHYFAKSIRDIFRIVPVAATLSLIYKISEALFPAFLTYLTVQLFAKAALYQRGEATLNSLVLYGVVILIGYGFKQIMLYISSITINAGVFEKVGSYLRKNLFEKSSRLTLLSYEDPTVLDEQKRAENCLGNETISMIFITGSTLVLETVSVIMISVTMASYHPAFLVICLASVLPFFAARIIRGKEFYQMHHLQAREERRCAYYWNMLSTKNPIKEARVMDSTSFFAGKWYESRKSINQEVWKLTQREALSMTICQWIKIGGFGIGVLLALYLLSAKTISIGVFSACLFALTNVQSQIQDVLIRIGTMTEKLDYAKDYYDYLDLQEESVNGRKQREPISEIQLHDVTFFYPQSDIPAIDRVSLNIKRGEKIVLVGENGSGKTTLSKLITGLYSVQGGYLSCGNNVYSELDQESFRSHISIVQQDFVQYQLSLRENIALSNLDKIDEDQRILMVMQMVDTGLEERPLDTQLGVRFGGTDLSIGQWQKVAIARAMYRDMDLIILDEPTSALDPMVENQILSKFMEIATGRTAIIVSHRVGICKGADRILVMKHGRIVEDGTHYELINQNGEYARLYHTQEQWYND